MRPARPRAPARGQPAPPGAFAFAVCQPGTERWLKAEVARLRPDLVPAFQRPGLVSFKATGLPFGADESLPTVFGRAWACSAGQAAEPEDVLAVAERVGARHLWCGPRDQGVPGDVPPAKQAAADADAATWHDALAASFDAAPPRAGATVLDVVTSPGEPAVVGWHVHGPGRHAGPVGRYGLALPESAPSRAWLKVEEGIRWSGAPMKAGQTVLEIGASPGGGTRALVDRGLNVIAVDANPLDPTLATHPQVRWIPRPIGDVPLDAVPQDTAWIVCDAKIPPEHVVRALGRWVKHLHLRGLLWTVKLLDARTATQLPKLRDEVRALGFARVDLVQLPSDRGDVFLAAFPADRAARP